MFRTEGPLTIDHATAYRRDVPCPFFLGERKGKLGKPPREPRVFSTSTEHLEKKGKKLQITRHSSQMKKKKAQKKRKGGTGQVGWPWFGFGSGTVRAWKGSSGSRFSVSTVTLGTGFLGTSGEF